MQLTCRHKKYYAVDELLRCTSSVIENASHPIDALSFKATLLDAF